jgi:hypothetical protein
VAQTVLLDVPTNLFVGHLMALSCHRQLAGEDAPFNRWFWRAMAYAFLIFVPVAGLFYYRYPDWSWVYVVRPADVPAWVGPLVLSAYGAGSFYGFLAAHAMIRRGHLGQAAASCAYALAVTLGVFGFTWHQYMNLGTYDTYHAGKATPIAADATFWVVFNGGGACMILGAAAILAWNWWEGRRWAGS